MKIQNQKGFIPTLILIIVGVLVVGSGVVYLSKPKPKAVLGDYLLSADIDEICKGDDNCYYTAGVDQLSVEFCEKITEESLQQYCSDGVNEKLATKNLNVQYCLKMTYPDECINDLASVTGDTSICQYSIYEKWRCLDYANLRDEINQAIETKDQKICESLDFYQDKDQCFSELGIALNNPLFCKLAKTQEYSNFDQAHCYKELAIYNSNSDYCGKIMDFGNWGEVCLDNIKIIEGYTKRCSEDIKTNKDLCLPMAVQIFKSLETHMSFQSRRYAPIQLKYNFDKLKADCDKLGVDNVVNECKKIYEEIYQKEKDELSL
ncbi:MAG: hypothetical protein KAJ58_01850 [Candidatus Pacebacteria bacterium]|nr:hypothetical protein [Candidatus Paceibacterota bacterium]